MLWDLQRQKEEQYKLEKLAAIGQMTAGIAHEIKNPLNTISVSAQTIKKRNLSREENIEEEYIPSTKDELQEEKRKRTDKILDELENKFLIKLLNSTQGNITNAAEISGYDRRQIQNLLSKHNIDAEKFRK